MGDRDRYQRCRRSPAWTASSRRRSSTTARPTTGVPSARPQQWFAALRERGVPTHARPLPGRVAPVHPRRPPLAPSRLQPPRHGLAGAACRRTRRPSVATARRRALAASAGRPGGTSPRSRRRPRHPSRRRRCGRDVRRGATACSTRPPASRRPTTRVFQIGSMTKVWTATLVMQLVDEGKLDLDAPVSTCCPSCGSPTRRWPARSRCATCSRTRAASTATSSRDTGRGDDCLEQLRRAARGRRAEPPARRHLVVLQLRLHRSPAGSSRSSPAARGTPRITRAARRAARPDAHRDPARGGAPAPRRGRPRRARRRRAASAAAAWGIAARTRARRAGQRDRRPTCSRSHGCISPAVSRRTARGSSARQRRAMTEHQADLPDKYTLGDSWGLGWIRFGWDGRRLIGHDGNTLGQAAFLRAPARRRARGHAPHQRRKHPRSLRGSLPRDLRRARRRRDAASAHAAERACRGRRGPRLGTYERAGAGLEVLGPVDGPVCARR